MWSNNAFFSSFFVVLIVITPLVGVYTLTERLAMHRYETRGVVASAQVGDVNAQYNRRNITYHVDVTFFAKDITDHLVRTDIYRLLNRKIVESLGETADVRYLPNNPEKAVFVASLDPKNHSLIQT